MEKEQELDLLSFIWAKVSEFEELNKLAPTDIVLPSFLKYTIIIRVSDFGDTYISPKGDLKFMGMDVHWTNANIFQAIIVFESIK